MKVLIKIKCLGSEDGCRILQFKAGKEYDISDKLAESFIKRDYAIEVNPTKEAQPTIKESEEDNQQPTPQEKKEEVIEEKSKEDSEKEELSQTNNNEKKSKSEENTKVKKKRKKKEISKKMANSYENKAIFSAPKNKSKIIKKIKLKKGNK